METLARSFRWLALALVMFIAPAAGFAQTAAAETPVARPDVQGPEARRGIALLVASGAGRYTAGAGFTSYPGAGAMPAPRQGWRSRRRAV